MRKVIAVAAAALLVAMSAACGDDDSGDSGDSNGAPALSAEQRDNETLVLGETLFADNCARCHGAAGQGLNGPSLQTVDETYPDIADQMTVISDGRGGMPAFGGRLSAHEIEAVARYEREVL